MNDPSFSSLGLAEAILSALERQGYEKPTPIQSAAIPALLAGRDLLGCAQTGTGKTAAFALPIIQRLSAMPVRPAPRGCRALVVAPTRELAAQIDASFAVYGADARLSRACVFGGVGKTPQVKALSPRRRYPDRDARSPPRSPSRGPGPPGFRRSGRPRRGGPHARHGLHQGCKADNLAFFPRTDRPSYFLPPCRATSPGLANSILRDPVRVSVTPEKPTVDLIEQKVAFVEKAEKRAFLAALINAQGDERAIVFTRTKHGADRARALPDRRRHSRRGDPREQEPEQQDPDDGRLPSRQPARPRGDRPRRPRDRRRWHQSRIQLRASRGARDLRPPHRPHRSRRRERLRDRALRSGGEAPAQGDREAPEDQRALGHRPPFRKGRGRRQKGDDRGSRRRARRSRSRPTRPLCRPAGQDRPSTRGALREQEREHRLRQGGLEAGRFDFGLVRNYICAQGG